MSRNGSGVYSLPAGNPVVAGTTISSSWANSTLSDIATALTGSLAADGQTVVTGNLQMGGYKLTGLGAGSASTDSVNLGQITGGTLAGVFTSVTDSGLTSGRVTYATTAGLLTDSANLTYDGTTFGVVGRLYNGSASSFGASSWAMSLGNGGSSANYFKGDNFYFQLANGTQFLATDSNGNGTAAKDWTFYGITVGRGAGALTYNTAVGASALSGSNSGSGQNTAVGYEVLKANTTGAFNSALGLQALALNTTGSNNTALGYNSLAQNTTASNNTAVGYQAAYSGTTGLGGATHIGYQSGYSSNAFNTAVGYQSLYSNTTGASNSAFDYYALGSNTTGSYNVAIGNLALRSNTTASNNTAVGYQAGYQNTAGSQNTLIGTQAGYNVTNYTTSTPINTFVGYQAGYGSNTLGYYANTAVGVQAGFKLSSGTYNDMYGVYAGYNLTTGNYNSAIGNSALFSLSTGSQNVAVGPLALYNLTTASNNTAVGYQALYSTTDVGNCVAVGYQAGYTFNGDYGYNTLIGYKAGYSLSGTTSAYGNTFVGANSSTGQGAGYAVTSGSNNTIIGGYSGNQGGLDIRTSSNYIVLSDGDGNPRMICNSNGQWGIGNNPSAWSTNYKVLDLTGGGVYGVTSGGTTLAGNTYINGSNQWIALNTGGNGLLVTGSSGILTYTAASVSAGSVQSLVAGPYLNLSGTSWTNSSDERLKNVTGEIQDGLSKVCTLRAAEFTWKADATNKPCVGLIAQDVEKVLPEAVNSSAYVMDDKTEYLGVQYTDVVPLLVAAIKELKAEVDSLKQQLGK